ncbi:ImmA/IrrE family metallo-endopeptidase, partial [Roseomonas sp. BN140053]|uniref:ImmA/IrrE family metallo-endopeptidase n=1 Tax=Roseomonas sp. BN140053 TaxID=3391898 RepID=UPI0039EB8358
ADLAREYSANVFPDDPIREVQGASLPGFEGALMRIGGSRGGWGIAYNEDISSPGRINFTLAHELGHYLVHRKDHPGGIQCSENDVVQGLRNIEREADQFAADLLMPLDDFRRQIHARSVADIAALSACAERYGVSLLAAILRWISYTERRAVLAVSRDGFLLWSRSSDAARKTGAFFRTAKDVVEVPEQSLAARQDMTFDNRGGAAIPPGVWFRDEVKEMTVFSEQYDMVMSLLLLGDAEPRWRAWDDDDEDPVAVPVDSRWR